VLADAENLAKWNELAAIQLFQQHPGNTYAEMVARADALALYLMSAVSVLADAEVKMAVIESEEEKRAIHIAAEGVAGIKRVEDHLETPSVIPAL